MNILYPLFFSKHTVKINGIYNERIIRLFYWNIIVYFLNLKRGDGYASEK